MSKATVTESVAEDLFVLTSIYCGDGECEIIAPPGLTFEKLENLESLNDHILSNTDIVVKLIILLDKPSCDHELQPVTLRISVPTSDPIAYPRLDVESNGNWLSLDHIKRLNCMVSTFMESHTDYCLCTLVEYVKEELQQYLIDATQTVLSSSQPCYSAKIDKPAVTLETHAIIAYLDHMRSTSKYSKLLNSWAMELSISETILNAGIHNIYIVLIGRPADLNKFVKMWKTNNVDIDSQGHPCRERKLSIICQQAIGTSELNL